MLKVAVMGICKDCSYLTNAFSMAEIETAVVVRDVEQVPSIIPDFLGVVEYYEVDISFEGKVGDKTSCAGSSVAENHIRLWIVGVKVAKHYAGVRLENAMPVRKLDLGFHPFIPFSALLLNTGDRLTAPGKEWRAVAAHTEFEDAFYRKGITHFPQYE